MRIVPDTNILVRANPKVSPPGLACELLLRIVSDDSHTLILSPAILAETQRVLRYPRVQKRWPLSEEAISQYLTALAAAAFVVELPKIIPAIVSDPDDDPILQTAVLGRADVLCTRDDAFNHAVVEEFCRRHGIRIVDDVTLMREIRRSSGE
ncbi:MAG TPA: putative toxin-antitoxin system toxin component, PIN family [Candidatus Acidoferrales bacterium]|nr:putative toxin-antitoxin system toxin component, PIN family [Candidatus Acidoferrales bacterium]